MIVYTLLSNRKLDEKSFLRYLSDKIKKTQKKIGISENSRDVYCIDDACIDIVYGLMKNKNVKLKKSAFLYCLRKEIEIFARIKKIRFNFIIYSGLKLKIREMLDELEKKHPEIKYSILRSHEKSEIFQ
jgi:hypothetical protein